jgi:hypothetical protein
MLLMSCIVGLEPSWQNSHVQYPVQAVTTWSSVQRSMCSWWSVTSKYNRLKQPRMITVTDLVVCHQQNL